MLDCFARLIACEVPRMTALCICSFFEQKRMCDALERYVDAVEHEYSESAQIA